MSCTRPDFLTSIFPTRPSRRSFRLQQFSSASSSCFTTKLLTFYAAQIPPLGILSGNPTQRLPRSPSSGARTGRPPTAPPFSPACALWWAAARAASPAAARRTAPRFCSASSCAAGRTEPRAQAEEEVCKWPLTSLFQSPLAPVLLKANKKHANC